MASSFSTNRSRAIRSSRSLARLGGLLVAAVASVATAHPLLVQGKGRLARLDDAGKVVWEMPWGGIHDLHVLPGGHILTQRMPATIVEIDPETKSVVWSYDANAHDKSADRVEIHSFVPLKGGNILLALTGERVLREIDREGKTVSEKPLRVDHPDPHTDTRLIRLTPSDTVLVCHEADGTLREYDRDGGIVWEYEVPLFDRKPAGGHGPDSFGNKLFAAVRLPNGNTLIATGNGHSVIEVTPEKEVVWKVGQNDLLGVRLAWVTTLTVLPSGNIIVGNCHAGPGQPVLVEIEPKSKSVVWTWDGYDSFGNDVSNTVVLDTPDGTIR